MKTKLSLSSWLSDSILDGGSVVRCIHLDRLENKYSSNLVGIDLARFSYQLLLNVLSDLQKYFVNPVAQNAIVFLPLGVSDAIMEWEPEIWEKVSGKDEPPSLYIIKREQIFDDDMEEYHRPVRLPFDCASNVRAIFRSFRDDNAIRNSWEFTSGIYLIANPAHKVN